MHLLTIREPLSKVSFLRVDSPVKIFWYNVACLGKPIIEETCYYEIATPLWGSQ